MSDVADGIARLEAENEALRRRLAELEQSEARYRLLVERGFDGVVLISEAGTVVYQSPNVPGITGYAIASRLGRDAFETIYPDDLPMLRSVFRAVMASRGAVATNVEFRAIRPDGDMWWAEASAINLLHDPIIQAIVVNYRDISSRKHLEAEGEKLQAQLLQAQKMEAVGRLAGGVAHDFNNVLGAILANTDLALEELGPDHPVSADLIEIRKAAERSADLTRQLLAFARKQTITPRVLDLDQTITGMLKMLRRLLREDVTLEWVPGTATWPVRLDPTQLDQILVNLCINARDAIADVGRITLETANCTIDEGSRGTHLDAAPGDYVRIAVVDDGCGMEPEVKARLFEPFFTTKGVGRGSGLGLATVHGIVEQNRGFIDVSSEPGHGTTFRIYLPRYSGSPTVLAAAARDAGQPARQGTVLLVEDEPALLRVGRLLLEKLGYEVLAAGTPGEALRVARDHVGTISLLMTDVVMPEMNGLDLARALLAFRPHMRCLFTSGYPADVIAHHGVLDEGVHFLQKPFSRQDLVAKLRETLAEN